jgi:hypothetical protein
MNVRTIPGRVRLRAPALRKPLTAWPLREELKSLPGVEEVEANIRVGSLLVCYDPKELSEKRILDLLDARLPGGLQLPATRPAGTGPLRMTMQEKRVLYYTMLSGLGTSLAALLIDSKKVHFIAGLLFLSGLSLHLTDKRKILIP